MSDLFGELSGQMGELLKKRRSGVVAALVAACGRTRTCESQACKALATALCCLSQWADRSEPQVLAPALMALDTFSTLGQNLPEDDRCKLSAPGCAVLITLLRFPKVSRQIPGEGR